MSATPRLHVDSELAPGARLKLGPEQSHYLARVLRLPEGAAVRLFNARDGEYFAEITEAAKKCVTLVAGRQLRPTASAPDLWLLFAPIRKSLTDLIIEKSVELGVSKILPVRTMWTNGPPVRSDRLERIIIEAAEQTERLDIPELLAEQALADVIGGWPSDRKIYYCDEAGEESEAAWGGNRNRAPPMLEVLAGGRSGPVAILIGPEGGFAPEERKDLRNRPYVAPVSLGPRILRAETAAIAALTLWQASLGDWADSAPDN